MNAARIKVARVRPARRGIPFLGALVLLGLVIALLLPVVAQAGVNDYPANLKNCAQDSRVDPWGFYNRECTSFVAWRMNRNAGAGAFTNTMRGGRWGNASNWAANARRLGYPVNSTPKVGSIAWFSFGHVAYVEAVNANGTVTIEEYNYSSRGNYDERSIRASSVSGYIHFRDIGR